MMWLKGSSFGCGVVILFMLRYLSSVIRLCYIFIHVNRHMDVCSLLFTGFVCMHLCM